MSKPTPSRIQIRRPGAPPVQDRKRLLVLGGAWLLSLVLAALLGAWLGSPGGDVGTQLKAAEPRNDRLQVRAPLPIANSTGVFRE